MNVFNRVLVILLLVVLIPVLLLIIGGAALPSLFVGPLREALNTWEPATNMRITTILIAGILLLIVLALLFAEFRRRTPQTVRLTRVANGEAELTTLSIEQRLTQTISQVPDVIKVKPVVISRRKGVDVVLDLETHPEVDVPAKTDEVVGVVRDVIENKIGLTLLRVKVNLKLAESAGGRRRIQPSYASPVQVITPSTEPQVIPSDTPPAAPSDTPPPTT